MFKRSFRSRDVDTSMTMDSQYRVDKASRLARKGGATNVGSTAAASNSSGTRNPIKLAKLQRSLTGDKNMSDPYTSTSRMQIDLEDPTPHQQARGSPPNIGKGGAGGGSVKTASAGNAAKDFDPMLGPIVTMVVGPQRRLFAAHENVLCQVPFFEKILRSDHYLRLPADDATGRRIALPDEEPHALSAVLEYLYKGDYTPRLVHNKQRDTWELEDDGSYPLTSPSPRLGGGVAAREDDGATVEINSGQLVLRDTVVYCGAERFGLDGLKRLALRKQGLRTGIDVGTILRSAQYCYANTPDSDVRLRAHYLAVIIRSRRVFKRSGTMQAEMERMGNSASADTVGEGGGKLFFDLFVAMCNHLDDVLGAAGNARSPKII